MIWLILQKIGFGIFLVLSIHYVLKKKYESLVSLYFWGIGFACCFVFFLTIWTPVKLVSLAMLWCLMFHKKVRPLVNGSTSQRLFNFLLIILFIGNIVALVTPKPIATFANPSMRVLLQDFSYLTNGAILLFGMMLRPGFIQRIYPKYCKAVEATVIIGVVHFICMEIGIGFMPILRTTAHEQIGNDAASVIANFGGIEQVRIYGFAGEPKGLGFFVAPYLASSIFCLFQEKYRNGKKYYHIGMLILSSFVLYNTFSSSALIALILVLPIILIFSSYKLKASHVIITFCVLLGGLISSIQPNDGSTSFKESMYERTFGRGENELENDRQETQIFEQYKKENIGYQIFGWGVGQYTFHVAGQAFDTSLRTLQSGLVLSFADFGIWGLCFYFYVAMIIISFLRRPKNRSSHELLAFAIISATSFIGSLMYGSFLTCAIFLMILLSSTDYKNMYE